VKRLISLAALLLALSMTLCACGDKAPEEGQGDTPPSDGQSTQVDAQTPPEGEGGTVDLAAIKSQFLSDFDYKDYVDVDTAGLGAVYGIDTSKVAASAAFNATKGGAFPHEVVMIQATDEAAAKEMQTLLTNHLADIAQQAASYDPASEALAKSCGVVAYDTYVGMFFTENCKDMTEDFAAAVS
jgi:predicted small lipoprotein YifL